MDRRPAQRSFRIAALLTCGYRPSRVGLSSRRYVRYRRPLLCVGFVVSGVSTGRRHSQPHRRRKLRRPRSRDGWRCSRTHPPRSLRRAFYNGGRQRGRQYRRWRGGHTYGRRAVLHMEVASGGTGERVGRAAALSVALEAAVQTDVSLAAGHGGHSQSVGATVLESRRVAVQPDAPTAIALADVLVARHHGRQHRRWRGRRMYGRCAAQHMEWPVAALAHGSAGQPRSHSHRRQRSSQT